MFRSITTTDNEKIAYQVSPAESRAQKKVKVILLHGLGGDLSVWQSLENELTQAGYTCVTIDLRGHGGSSRPEKAHQYAILRLAQDVEEVLLAENIKEIILIGHCLGAIVAQELAATNPALVHQLILLAPTYQLHWWLRTLGKYRLFRAAAQRIAATLPAAHLQQRFMDSHWWRGRSDFSARRIAGDLLRTSLKSYGFMLEQLFRLNLTDRLTHLHSTNMPILMIKGEKDHIFSARLTAGYATLLPKAEIYTLNRVNHQLLFAAPQQVSAKILAWLSLQPTKMPTKQNVSSKQNVRQPKTN